MERLNGRRDDQIRFIVGWAIGLFTFVVYNLTRAPTLSFWDCGEFIASASTLGIPHPPGTPLYVLIGRVFTMFPTSVDIAARVNLISTLTSAAAAMVTFFVLFRIIKGALGENGKDDWKTAACYVGAICGSLFMAFSNTHWNNAVETEVYGPSMFIIVAVIWLALRWMDTRETPKGTRYLIGIVYVGFASIGIHLTAFMVIPPVMLFVMLIDKNLRKDWRIWVTGAVLLTIAISFDWFALAWLGWTAVAAIMAITATRKRSWILICVLLIAAAAGFSNHLYIPIRSAQNPVIDENNPETLNKFRYYLARKQYGSESMIIRSFKRRGQFFANQLGDHARMGFWRFFKGQYGFTGYGFLACFALGIFGCIWLASRQKMLAMLMITLLLLGSIGLVWYMNFADGTRFDPISGDAYIEVRDRDYFFTPGFIFFGMMMGIGLAGLIESFFRSRKKKISGKWGWLGLVFVLLPIYQLQANYVSCDRSEDFIPWDYAYNILNFCEQDAILFTSGDNDTFPVWCLQETYGVRKDVSVVNLSLGNTDWYIKQMRDNYNLLDTTITDKMILWTVPTTLYDPAGNKHELLRPAEKYPDPITHTNEYLFPRPNPQTGGTLRVQDQLIELILQYNRWRRPVFFSGSLAGKSRFGLENHAVQAGILYKVVPEDASGTFDPDLNATLFGDSCQYRGVDNIELFRSESTTGNMMIYPEKFLQIAEAYRRRGDTTKSLEWAERATQQFPHYWRGPLVWADYLTAQGDSTAADSVIASAVKIYEKVLKVNPDNRYYHMGYGLLAERQGRLDVAQKYLEQAFYANPSDPIAFQSLIIFAQPRSLDDVIIRACRKWLEYFPNDEFARQVVAISRGG